MLNKILVTGGAGYIGSHTCVELIDAGFNPVIVDNLSNSSIEVLNRIEAITGTRPLFYKGDILDESFLNSVFAEHSFACVIHFAGFKNVGESCEQPLRYYRNNVTGTLTLLKAMERANCKNIIFSSSATVYGPNAPMPCKESFGRGIPANPYGSTKAIVEQMLEGLTAADTSWNAVILRYFNPVGAHKSGLIGEDPLGIPNNLTPYITQVAIGKLSHVNVLGTDYKTPDGTGVRDYIHVVDLAQGHIAALNWMLGRNGVETFNLGTGRGYSVFEVIHAFEDAVGRKIPYEIKGRRAGDVACYCADVTKAKQVLNWQAQFGLAEMAQDAWHWQQQNPNGYRA